MAVADPVATAPRRAAAQRRRRSEPRRAAAVRPPKPDERASAAAVLDRLPLAGILIGLAVAVASALLVGLCVRAGWFGAAPLDQAAVKVLVERIIVAESDGDPNKTNKRSSAVGAAQFLDDTWREALKKHRRDLLQGRSDKEVLELRRDADLSREIATRLVGEYAAVLSKRGLPVTPGSLYLAHFAGPAGAVALLSGADSADAATLMAAADSTGRTTRARLVSANPFLKQRTVGDLKQWADRKMAPRRL